MVAMVCLPSALSMLILPMASCSTRHAVKERMFPDVNVGTSPGVMGCRTEKKVSKRRKERGRGRGREREREGERERERETYRGATGINHKIELGGILGVAADAGEGGVSGLSAGFGAL